MQKPEVRLSGINNKLVRFITQRSLIDAVAVVSADPISIKYYIKKNYAMRIIFDVRFFLSHLNTVKF